MTKQEKNKNDLKELMRLHYGFGDFRVGQEKAIDSVLGGKSSVVIMPTGGGKSLCYQLPALILEGVTIVISPLIALMKDQVDSLNKVGIPATFINSSVGKLETINRINDVKAGVYKLLYIAPERFYNNDFLEHLKEIKVSLFAIDEAHCISQWGHDFRPSYIRLSRAIEFVGNPPVIALTATATPEVREDIIKQLKLKDPEVIITGFTRPNLQFGVIQANEARKPQYVLDAVNSVPGKSGIIYVGIRARVDSLLEFLLSRDIEAVGYHAGMEAEDRKWVQNNFLRGQAKIIVATNAFGLGIDKPDIRFVIHYDMPGTVEAYYQEAGRAGRDSKPSFCLLLYNSRDRALHEFFIKGDNPSPSNIREIYGLLTSYESEIVLITYSELSDMLSDNLPDMAIGTGLKLLEKEGYIARSSEKSANAFLKFNKDFNYIYDSLGTRAKKQREVVAKLNDRFGSELTQGWNFSPHEIAEILEIKKETLMRVVRKLSDSNLVEYNPPFKGTEIRILKRLDPKELKFNEEEMKVKLRRAYKKLDLIEDYVFNLGCRQQYILKYFGDSENRDCKVCDFCTTGQALKIEGKGRSRRTGKKNFDVKPPQKKSALSTKLTQLETLELYNDGKSIKEIAKARKIKEDTVINHLAFLIEKSLIKNIGKLVDSKKQMEIKKAIKKVGQEKLKPIYMELKEKIDYNSIKLVIADLNKK